MKTTLGGIEFEFSAVVNGRVGASYSSHDIKVALDGTHYIQSRKKKKGRLLDLLLQWPTEEQVQQLQTWANDDAHLVLELPEGVSINVVFDLTNSNPVDLEPLVDVDDRTAFSAEQVAGHYHRWQGVVHLREV